jgi:hypothetical protein
MWKWKHFIIITALVEQWGCYWHLGNKETRNYDGVPMMGSKTFLQYTVQRMLASQTCMAVLQVWPEWKGSRVSIRPLPYRVTLTATSSWVALVRTRNSWFRMVGRKAIITWPSIACRLYTENDEAHVIFVFYLFWDGVLLYCSSWPGTTGFKWSSYLKLPSSWDHRHMPPCSATLSF